MAQVKAALKAAKSALDAQDYDNALIKAKEALESDSQNYFAHVFAGRAQERLGRLDDAITAYERAAKIKPSDELAWKGLCSSFEAKGSQGVDGHTAASVELARIYTERLVYITAITHERDDRTLCQSVVDNLVAFAKKNGSRYQFKDALHVLLPNGPVYNYLEGLIQSPSLTFQRLAEMTEEDEKDLINRIIGERRTRLGAKIAQVTAEVTREVYRTSSLTALYRDVINWTLQDEVRRQYEEKLFQRTYDHLAALPSDEKREKRQELLKMADDIVLIKHPFERAWELSLNTKDLDSLETLDSGVLFNFVSLFPTSGLASLIEVFLGQRRRPKTEPPTQEIADEDNEIIPFTLEEKLLLLDEGLENTKSPLGYRIASDFFNNLQEYETCIEVSRTGLALLAEQVSLLGVDVHRNQSAIELNLGTALVFHQSPKNHPEAKDIFNGILKKNPDNTRALLGLGLILEEQENFEQAFEFLSKASKMNPNDPRIGIEAAWCQYLVGDVEGGSQALKGYLEILEKNKDLELRAVATYRVGRCLWDLHADKASRKDRNGAYAKFIACLKLDPNLAPAYTSLGIYYADYTRDKKRARQCFQKAFELSATEVQAAERLARAFADEKEWDIVELIANRVIESGVAKPSPGSKKRGQSWPFAALGVVQMSRQDFSLAVTSFQAALRLAPQDFNAWVGLGESYHSSGRYIAAQRALEHALSINKEEDTWFADYMLSNVHKELGNYSEAIGGYQKVLSIRKGEFGIVIALLQTLGDSAKSKVETGHFGGAVDDAVSALSSASAALIENGQFQGAFNFWKAVGDAFAVIGQLSGFPSSLPGTLDELVALLNPSHEALNGLDDGIERSKIHDSLGQWSELSPTGRFESAFSSAVMAYKRALISVINDAHARPVAWYNLGWAYMDTMRLLRTCQDSASPSLSLSRFQKCAVRCFKTAIENEAGNGDYWNALGVATTDINAGIAQHSFVRSLHLNERSARVWTNLGSLYLSRGDLELAHKAFSRAQSTDPGYPGAWIGEGMLALQAGNGQDALSHFAHAEEISDPTWSMARAQYAGLMLDNVQADEISDDSKLAQSILDLAQAFCQQPWLMSLRMLSVLIAERVGDFASATAALEVICNTLEERFEQTESATDLGAYAKAKAVYARIALATSNFNESIEHADTVLDLTAEKDDAAFSDSQQENLRLSAHVTAGLAAFRLDDQEKAREMFKAALDETRNSPTVVCLWAQALCAFAQDRQAAKDELFACIEKNLGHLNATTMIATVAAVEEDAETLDAVIEDLHDIRAGDRLSTKDRRRVARLLESIALITSGDDNGVEQAKVSIMVAPNDPSGWQGLADADSDNTGSQSLAHVASTLAGLSAPPDGNMDAVELSSIFAGGASTTDCQRSIMAAPWTVSGWNALGALLT